VQITRASSYKLFHPRSFYLSYAHPTQHLIFKYLPYLLLRHSEVLIFYDLKYTFNVISNTSSKKKKIENLRNAENYSAFISLV
jgi:hypothetical protein